MTDQWVSAELFRAEISHLNEKLDRVLENQSAHAIATSQRFETIAKDCQTQALAIGEVRSDVRHVKEGLDKQSLQTVVGGSASGGAFGTLASFLWNFFMGHGGGGNP